MRPLGLLALLAVAAPAAAQPPQWESIPPLPPLPLEWEEVADNPADSASHQLVWEPVATPEPSTQLAAIAWEPVPAGEDPLPPLAEVEPPAETIPLPPPPRLYAMNSSIAFGDGPVGPDITWRVPTGFRWTPHHWLDLTVNGFNRRDPGTDASFWAWNNGDAYANVFANVVNAGPWSFTISQTIRSVSVYNDPNIAGGSTAFGEGQSTGFRLARSLGPTAGFALGGEQIIQWDSYTDIGRTYYLSLSKGWWLGSGPDPYPLLTATGAIATGRLASDKSVAIACYDTGANRTDTYSIDNQLCWALWRVWRSCSIPPSPFSRNTTPCVGCWAPQSRRFRMFLSAAPLL